MKTKENIKRSLLVLAVCKWTLLTYCKFHSAHGNCHFFIIINLEKKTLTATVLVQNLVAMETVLVVEINLIAVIKMVVKCLICNLQSSKKTKMIFLEECKRTTQADEGKK